MKRKCTCFALAALFTFTGAVVLRGDEANKDFIRVITKALQMENTAVSEYYEDVSRKVVYARRSLVSYVITDTGYRGGAHANSSFTCGSIFSQTGKKLTLKDIATPAQRPILLKLITKELMKRCDGMTAEEFNDAIKPVLTENFYYSKQGLHFLYSPYEIASFVHGDFEVCVDWPLPKFVLEFEKKMMED